MPRPDTKLLTAQEVADLLRKPLATLYQWRSRRLGPPAFRVGRDLRYRQCDVQDWIDEQLTREERRRARSTP